MKDFTINQQMSFDCAVLDLMEFLEIHNKSDLEWFIDTLHERLEISAIDYAEDEGIKDYECQY